MFKWICFSTAALFGIVIFWLLYDLKRDVTSSLETAKVAVSEANKAATTVNAQLPEIIAEVKKGTETLSDLAEDVELIKSVAGIQSDQEDRGLRGLANYADQIQRVIAEETNGKGAHILIEEIIGSDLKPVETVEEFLVGLNREMVAIILPIARSKQEILYRACHSMPPRRKPYYIQFPEAEPVSLEAFLKEHHTESAALPAYQAD